MFEKIERIRISEKVQKAIFDEYVRLNDLLPEVYDKSFESYYNLTEREIEEPEIEQPEIEEPEIEQPEMNTLYTLGGIVYASKPIEESIRLNVSENRFAPIEILTSRLYVSSRVKNSSAEPRESLARSFRYLAHISDFSSTLENGVMMIVVTVEAHEGDCYFDPEVTLAYEEMLSNGRVKRTVFENARIEKTVGNTIYFTVTKKGSIFSYSKTQIGPRDENLIEYIWNDLDKSESDTHKALVHSGNLLHTIIQHSDNFRTSAYLNVYSDMNRVGMVAQVGKKRFLFSFEYEIYHWFLRRQCRKHGIDKRYFASCTCLL